MIASYRSAVLLFFLLGLAAKPMLRAQGTPDVTVFSIVLNFDGTHGSHPSQMVPIEDRQGNLWGTTTDGGAFNRGTVFELTPDGSLTTIHEFSGADGTDPAGSLVISRSSNFYGTTLSGGDFGYGVIYRVSSTGKFSVLHSFAGPDGSLPNTLLRGRDGAYYGTIVYGGTYDGGTIFRITSAGELTTLYSFDPSQSWYPQGLVQGSGGDFYGTTWYGGEQPECQHDCGTVFKFSRSGDLTMIYSFPLSFLNGIGPGPLIFGKDGWLYGTAIGGGNLEKCASDHGRGCGTIFRVNKKGKLIVLHAFENSDGAFPNGPLVQGPDGLLYGAARDTGRKHGDCGALFSISPKGRYHVLHYLLFPDGCFPEGGLLLHTNGKLYGTANIGGGLNWGDVFSLNVGFSR